MATPEGQNTQGLLTVDYVAGLASNFQSTGSPISSYYGVARNNPSTDVSDLPTVIYDIFDNTRNTSAFTTPDTGPNRVQQKPIGQRVTRGLYVRENLNFPIIDYVSQRSLGEGPASRKAVNDRDKKTRQIKDRLQRMDNLMEYSFVRTLMGSLQVLEVNGMYYPVESNGTETINYERDASQSGRLALGSGGANIIDTTWSNAGADIPTQLRTLRALGPRLWGGDYTDYWITTNVANYMLNNDKLQEQGGTSFRVWDGINEVPLRSNANGSQMPQELPKLGYYNLTFRALGESFTFHVCDQGLTLGDRQGETTEEAAWSTLIPENGMLVTGPPEPGTWYGRTDIGSFQQMYDRDTPKFGYGFMQDVANRAQPSPSEEVELINHFTYPIHIPKAILTPTVIF